MNPNGTTTNRAITYYDTSNIAQIYTEYLSQVKTRKVAENKEIAPYIEYIDVQLLPGDTYGNIFARIASNLESYGVHFDKYPNLRHIGSLNNSLKKEFLRQYIESSIKSDTTASWQDLLDGKIKPGSKFILHLSKANEIIGSLRDISYSSNVDGGLQKIDKDIIDLVVPMKQNSNIMKTSMILESYVLPNDKWYKPDGLRRMTKQTLEEYPSLQKLKSLNSFGDFQIRIKSLRKGWNDEWPKQKHIQ